MKLTMRKLTQRVDNDGIVVGTEEGRNTATGEGGKEKEGVMQIEMLPLPIIYTAAVFQG